MKKYFVVLLVSFNLFMHYLSVVDNTIEVSNSINIIFQDSSKILIDKGSYSGIEVGDIVLSNNALVGTIDEVTKYKSTVKLIIGDKNKVSVKSSNVYGLIDGIEDGFLIMTGFKGNIEIGSKVYTTGISYYYQPDIYVGDVYSFSDDKILIKTPADFENLSNITVLKK